MPTKAVRLTDLLVGANSLGYLVMVPGASVLIRQNGVALVGSAGPGTPAVFSDNNKTAMTNPVPTGVTPGTAGVDTAGRLVVYLNPGKGYDVQATVGNVTTTASLPDVGVDVDDVVEGATLTTDGDILTRSAGAPARLTRAQLAADAAFTAAYAGRANNLSDLADPKAALQNIGAFPLEPVRLMIDATLEGYRPIGEGKSTLYMLSDTSAAQLIKTTDRDLKNVEPLFQWAGTANVRYVWVTTAGTLLVLVTKAGGATADMWRSTDGGVTFAICNADLGNANLSALSGNVCQTPNGDIFYHEYSAVPSASTVKFWRSSDDGATWTALETFINQTGHVHGVWSDDEVPNQIWRGWGDNNIAGSLPRIEYSNDRGATWTTIGAGDQSWRTVWMLFTATEVFMGTDSQHIDQAIYAWNRQTGERRVVLDDADTTLFYGIQDNAGHFAWVSGSYAASDEVKMWVGRLDGSVRATQALSVVPRPDSVRIDQWLYGPDDAAWNTWLKGGPTGGTYTLSVTTGGSTQTTAAIAYNATAATVDAAVEALSNVGAGNVTVTGAGPFVITFGGALADKLVTVAAAANNLTGGTTPEVMVEPLGGFWHGVSDSQPTARTSKIHRCRLVSGNQAAAINIPLLSAKVRRPNGFSVGPDPASISTFLALTPTREYMMKFRAPETQMPPIKKIYVMNGPSPAGNMSLGIRAMANIAPGDMLGASPAIAQVGASVEQAFTLSKFVSLVPGQEYYLSLVSDNPSTGSVVGTGNTSFKASQHGCIVASGSTVPAPTAAPAVISAGFRFAALLTTT